MKRVLFRYSICAFLFPLFSGVSQAAETILFDDFDDGGLYDWVISFGGDNTTGWTQSESGTSFTVTDITDSTANVAGPM